MVNGDGGGDTDDDSDSLWGGNAGNAHRSAWRAGDHRSAAGSESSSTSSSVPLAQTWQGAAAVPFINQGGLGGPSAQGGQGGHSGAPSPSSTGLNTPALPPPGLQQAVGGAEGVQQPSAPPQDVQQAAAPPPVGQQAPQALMGVTAGGPATTTGFAPPAAVQQPLLLVHGPPPNLPPLGYLGPPPTAPPVMHSPTATPVPIPSPLALHAAPPNHHYIVYRRVTFGLPDSFSAVWGNEFVRSAGPLDGSLQQPLYTEVPQVTGPVPFGVSVIKVVGEPRARLSRESGHNGVYWRYWEQNPSQPDPAAAANVAASGSSLASTSSQPAAMTSNLPPPSGLPGMSPLSGHLLPATQAPSSPKSTTPKPRPQSKRSPLSWRRRQTMPSVTCEGRALKP